VNDNYNPNKIKTLDSFVKETQSTGSLKQSASNMLYGINQTQTMEIVPKNLDRRGYVFFTRPQLNLSTSNVLNVRKLFSLVTDNEYSIHRYVRCLLDPRQASEHGVTTPLVNNKLAFMPILTNSVQTISGWPDEVLPTFKSKPGIRKEQYSQGDGVVEINEVFNLDCAFRNMASEPLSHIFITWLQYISSVFEGVMGPYMDFITENEIE